MSRTTALLITGCSGFVGSALAGRAAAQGYTVIGTSRQAPASDGFAYRWVQMPDLEDSGWLRLLQQVDVVIHCAARVHRLKDPAEDPLAAYRAVNVQGTRRLAELAVQAGVRRFILLSTIKVNGEQTSPDKPFKASDPPSPATPYSISKWESEQVLSAICGAQVEWLIVRSPLVYGPSAKGNLALFAKLAKLRLPLPLGHIRNQRSLISLDHLTQFLLRCVSSETVNETLLIADSRLFSTVEIYRMVCRQVSCPAFVVTLPKALQSPLNSLLKWLDLSGRLTDSLAVDISDTLEKMHWQPPDR